MKLRPVVVVVGALTGAEVGIDGRDSPWLGPGSVAAGSVAAGSVTTVIDEVNDRRRRQRLAAVDLHDRLVERLTKLASGVFVDAHGRRADAEVHGPAAALIDLAALGADEGLDDVLQMIT